MQSLPPWHTLAPERIADILKVSLEVGLSDDEAAARLLRVGPNALAESKPTSRFLLLLRQYKSPLVYLLLGAGVLAFVLGHRTDAWVILAIVTANALLGAFQEGRAERSMAALRRLTAARVRVLRGGREREVEARAVVPGDLMLLGAGNAISADGRLIEALSLEVSAAALTGEPVPVPKGVAEQELLTAIGDRGGMVYAATQVTRGRGRAIVVATGLATEVGKIAALTSTAEEPATPLGRRIAAFGRVLIYAGVTLCAVIIALGLLRGIAIGKTLMLAVSQLVAVVPEGLPVAVTVALTLGARRMVQRGALVRRLVAVETLGSTTVICSDKTGTLTSNEMSVTAGHLASGRAFEVSGTGFAPSGRLEARGQVLSVSDPDVRALAEAALLCNDAALAPPTPADPQWRALGDPTEAALLAFAERAGARPEAIRAGAPRTAEAPFDAGTKMMATWHLRESGEMTLVKGAPERVLERCTSRLVAGARRPLDAEAIAALRAAWEAMADRALRVLAFAVFSPAAAAARGHMNGLEGGTLLGLVGQIDPPREGVREAIDRCRKAGIRVVMLTGDHAATAQAVARTLGIAGAEGAALDGEETARPLGRPRAVG